MIKCKIYFVPFFEIGPVFGQCAHWAFLNPFHTGCVLLCFPVLRKMQDTSAMQGLREQNTMKLGGMQGSKVKLNMFNLSLRSDVYIKVCNQSAVCM